MLLLVKCPIQTIKCSNYALYYDKIFKFEYYKGNVENAKGKTQRTHMSLKNATNDNKMTYNRMKRMIMNHETSQTFQKTLLFVYVRRQKKKKSRTFISTLCKTKREGILITTALIGKEDKITKAPVGFHYKLNSCYDSKQNN